MFGELYQRNPGDTDGECEWDFDICGLGWRLLKLWSECVLHRDHEFLAEREREFCCAGMKPIGDAEAHYRGCCLRAEWQLHQS